MAIQIANPRVAAKIERLARETGLNMTAAVEKAVDRLLSEQSESGDALRRRAEALLAQIDRIPDAATPYDPLEWDDLGLPR